MSSSSPSLFNKIAYLSAIILFGISCQFDLQEINTPEASPPTLENFNIKLIANDSSQLIIYKPTNFTFGITNNSKFDFGFQNIIITLDGKPIRDINYADFGESLGFTIDPRELEDGVYTLRITSESSFSGGSLASKTDATNTIFQEWEIVIDKTPDPIEITAVEIEDGELVVYWDPEVIRNFDEMYLTGESDNFYGSKYVEVDRLANKAVFPYFIEGVLNLEIRTSTDYDIMSIGPSFEYVLEENLVEFQLQDSTVSVNIKKPSLYNHVTSFNVNGNSFDSFDSNMMSFELESGLLFGSVNDYYVSFKGTQGNHYTYEESLGIGKDMPPYQTILYNEANQSFYARFSGNIYLNDLHTEKLSGTFIFKLDEELNILDTLTLNSIDNQYAPFTSTQTGDQLIVVMATTKDVYFIDPINLNVLETINLFEEYGYDSYPHLLRYGAKMTTNNILYVRGASHIAINIDTETELFRDGGGIVGQEGDISDDGSYIFNGGTLYEWNGSSYEIKSEIDLEYKSGVFLNNKDLFHFNGENIEIIDASTLAVSNTFTFSGIDRTEHFGGGSPTESFLRIQKDENKIIMITPTGDRIDVIDYSGNIISSTQVNLGSTFFYHNNYLFGGGRAIRLEL